MFQALCKIKLVWSHSNSLHCLCLCFLHWVICGKPLKVLQVIWKNTYFQWGSHCFNLPVDVQHSVISADNLLSSAWWEVKRQETKVEQERFQLDIRKRFSLWGPFKTGTDFRGLVQFLSSEAFKIRLGKSQSNLVRPHRRPCFEQEHVKNNLLMSPPTWSISCP